MKPCKRQDFIRRLRNLGFDGPFAGARHHFMIYKQYRLSIPTNTEYSVPQLEMMLREVAEILGRKVSAGEWDGLR